MKSEWEWEYNTHFKNNKIVLLLFFISIVCSTLYAIYLYNVGQLPVENSLSYLRYGETIEKISLGKIAFTFITYMKRYFAIWVVSIIQLLWPIGFALACFEVFSYGFILANMYLYEGWQGIINAVQFFLVQGVIFSVLLVKLLSESYRRTSRCWQNLLIGCVGCLIITLVELILYITV